MNLEFYSPDLLPVPSLLPGPLRGEQTSATHSTKPRMPQTPQTLNKKPRSKSSPSPLSCSLLGIWSQQHSPTSQIHPAILVSTVKEVTATASYFVF